MKSLPIFLKIQTNQLKFVGPLALSAQSAGAAHVL